MKIIPNSDILISGVHSPAGQAVEVKDSEALSLIAQGFARRAPTSGPVIETASAVPAVETAAATPVKAGARKAAR